MKDKTFVKLMQITGAIAIITVIIIGVQSAIEGHPIAAWSFGLGIGAGLFMVLFSPVLDMSPSNADETTGH